MESLYKMQTESEKNTEYVTFMVLIISSVLMFVMFLVNCTEDLEEKQLEMVDMEGEWETDDDTDEDQESNTESQGELEDEDESQLKNKILETIFEEDSEDEDDEHTNMNEGDDVMQDIDLDEMENEYDIGMQLSSPIEGVIDKKINREELEKLVNSWYKKM